MIININRGKLLTVALCWEKERIWIIHINNNNNNNNDRHNCGPFHVLLLYYVISSEFIGDNILSLVRRCRVQIFRYFAMATIAISVTILLLGDYYYITVIINVMMMIILIAKLQTILRLIVHKDTKTK